MENHQSEDLLIKIVRPLKKTFFSTSKISTPWYIHEKSNIKTMLVRAEKRFRTTWDISEISEKQWIFALPKYVSVKIPTKTCFGTAKIQFFAIISETPQVVLKRFQGRTNISLMFPFPWLDRGIDISYFEKIDFLARQTIFAQKWRISQKVGTSQNILRS